MKTNVGGSKNDWLLKLSCRNESGTYEYRYINCWNKTTEEVMSIAAGYYSSDTFVRVYKLMDVLEF